MSDFLPKAPIKASRINPRITILYGKPKVGKTKILSMLQDCLTLCFEPGAEMYDMVRIRITSTVGYGQKFKDPETGEISMTLDDFSEELGIYAAEYQQANPGKPIPPPYKYLAIDTLDELEDMSEDAATVKYKNSSLGKKFEDASVLLLPNGGGYYHLRNEVIDKIKTLSMMCKHLILICHVREKNIDKAGIAVSVMDLSLTGKLSQIVAAAADAIGYLYREPGKPLMVSFATSEGLTMGARFERLAGKTMEFDWDKIFIPE
jgi:hypothetical protein